MRGNAAAEVELMEQLAKNEAAKIRFLAHKEDYNFFVFQEQLKTMTSVLGAGKTALLLSTHHSVFDFLFRPPRPDGSWAEPGPLPVAVRQPGEPRRQPWNGKGE